MIRASVRLAAVGMNSMEDAEAELNRQARQWFGLQFECRPQDYEIVIVAIHPDSEVYVHPEGKSITTTWDVDAVAGTKEVLKREGYL